MYLLIQGHLQSTHLCLMRHRYICIDCLEKHTGVEISKLDVNAYNEYVQAFSFSNPICPECSGNNTKKLLGIETSYVRGYGFLDKAGAKRDMDLHKMVSGNDPYKESRKPGDSSDLILRLQKSKEKNKQAKKFHV